jgi:uncharacterized membrane protein
MLFAGFIMLFAGFIMLFAGFIMLFAERCDAPEISMYR